MLDFYVLFFIYVVALLKEQKFFRHQFLAANNYYFPFLIVCSRFFRYLFPNKTCRFIKTPSFRRLRTGALILGVIERSKWRKGVLSYEPKVSREEWGKLRPKETTYSTALFHFSRFQAYTVHLFPVRKITRYRTFPAREFIHFHFPYTFHVQVIA